MRIRVEPVVGPPLFDWILEPVGDVGEKGVGTVTPDGFEGRANRVQVGVPQIYDLRDLMATEALDPTVRAGLDEFEFLLVRLACSFLPDRRTRYVWARYAIELKSSVAKGSASGPLAFDLYPRSIERHSTVKRGFEVTPSLKLSFVEAGLKSRADSETIEYTPQLSAAGLLTSTPSWTFESKDRQGLLGVRELFLVVKQSRGEPCLARFNVSAEGFGLLGPIPLRRRSEQAGAPEFIPLTPH